jgi:hypothetical protein
VQKKKGCHKKERNSQKSGRRNSAGCKAIASSMPKPKTRCTSVEAETTIMLSQRGTENLYSKKEVISGKKTEV